MKQTLHPLTEWVIQKIKAEYPNDVALLVAVEGASVNSDGHGEAFDYFVPATPRGEELTQTFIIGGIGKDLYPRSWERMERTASLDDPATQCLGNAKILYARSQADIDKFTAIQQTLADNLNNPAFIYRKALENLDMAMDLYRTMMFEERLYKVRGLAGYIHRYLTTATACLNKTYRKAWHYGMLPEIAQWETLPNRFAEYYQAILAASTVGELKSLAHLLIASARQFIAGHKPQANGAAQTPNFQELADWYQELRTWWKRLYHFCDAQDADASFYEACQLQGELDIVGNEFGLGEMDLLGCFDAANLLPLRKRAEELEKAIIAAIEGQSVTIRSYDTLADFLANNQ